MSSIGKVLEEKINPPAVKVEVAPVKMGNLTADGTEQTLLEFVAGKISGYVNLENMVDGDTTLIKEYMKIKGDGAYMEYHHETYAGGQSIPLVHITPKAVDAGLKITLRQTAGAFKSFGYDFVRET